MGVVSSKHELIPFTLILVALALALALGAVAIFVPDRPRFTEADVALAFVCGRWDQASIDLPAFPDCIHYREIAQRHAGKP